MSNHDSMQGSSDSTHRNSEKVLEIADELADENNTCSGSDLMDRLESEYDNAWELYETALNENAISEPEIGKVKIE